MQLPELCIKKPVFTIVLSLVIVLIGIIFFTKLEVRDTPNVAPPLITVTATYAGADASYMERQITQKIEKELRSTKNVETIVSTSKIGESKITLVLKLDSDIEVALSDIRSKISGVSKFLPDDMQLPSVEKLDADAWPSIWITVNSDIYDDLELTRITDNQIKSVLEKLSTVGNSIIFGARYYTMTIEPIISKMFQYKLSPFELESAILAQNQDYPAGVIKSNSRDFSVKLSGTLNTVEEFQNIIVKTQSDGNSVIKLRDVANVSLESFESDVFLRYNGKPSLAIGLVKQSTANIIQLSDSVKEKLPQIRKNLPSGINVEIAYDGSTPVNASINAVYVTIFEAIILVGIVTYLFLGSLKITLIPLITIPISLIGTFSVMYLLGFSVNTFTLLAMILAIGLVVDDAIVMMENIYRHVHELGKEPLKAASDGSKQIGFTIIAMTITLASVFFPVGFIEGMLGKLFVEFAWTLAFCVLFSGVIALTLTPMMSSRMIDATTINRPKLLQLFEDFVQMIQNLYIHSLQKLFILKKTFLMVCIIFITLLIFGMKNVSKTFVPEEDQGFLMVFFKGPEGSTVPTSLKTVQEAEKVMGDIKEIHGYFDIVGNNGGEEATAFVPMKKWDDRDRSQQEVKAELNHKLSQIPGMTIFAVSPPSIGGRRGDKEIEFYISSLGEYDEIEAMTDKFLSEMKNIESLIDVERDYKSSTPTLDIKVNREKAYRYGVGIDIIGRTVQYLIAGQEVGDFRIGADIYDVLLRYDRKNRDQANDLKNILLKNNNGEMLPIETVADLVETITVKSLSHYNNSRAIKMTANLAPGYSLQDAVQDIDQMANKIIQNGKFKLEYDGQIKQMQESSGDTMLVFIFALLFIFLVLAAQFESFGDSLMILIAVPFSITGGVLTLWMFDNSLNMYSNIGLITLIGLVTKNSIMIVEFANQLREEGMKVYEAILKAAQLRFRPIIMTTIAAVIGAMPLVLESGAGAAARQSIGLVIVGGLSIGTIFTIFVIPILYYNIRKES